MKNDKLGKKYVYHHKKTLLQEKNLNQKLSSLIYNYLPPIIFLSSHLLLFILLFYSIPLIQESIL